MTTTQTSWSPLCDARLTVPTQPAPVLCELAGEHTMHIGHDDPMPDPRGRMVRVERRWVEGLPGSNSRGSLTGLNERNT